MDQNVCLYTSGQGSLGTYWNQVNDYSERQVTQRSERGPVFVRLGCYNKNAMTSAAYEQPFSFPSCGGWEVQDDGPGRFSVR